MTAPEPWREQPASRTPHAYPQDPFTLARDKRHQVTEFGWGAGLVAPHANGRPPSEGGIYLPKAPPVELPGQSLTPRQKHRPPGEVRGYPGDRAAR